MLGTSKEHGGKTIPVSELLSEQKLDLYGYLLLPIAVMRTAGSAAQTVAGIRSHWGRKTYADERTIAVAACLDESTVRRRHLPKLRQLRFMDWNLIDSPRGKRRLWYFTKDMQAAGYWTAKAATLPRWAALLLPEWSYRAVYATVLQRALATSRGSRNGHVELEIGDTLWGGYGRHNFSLSHLVKLTGLTRESVVAAKHYLLNTNWLTRDTGYGRGEELFINGDLAIPAATVQRAHETTRSMMFHNHRKEGVDVRQ
jgi:hypothetical protein